MICLTCGEYQEKANTTTCESCDVGFVRVPGIYGTNHMSQLIQAVQELEEGKRSQDEVLERFAQFMEVWDEFDEAWGWDAGEVQAILEAFPALKGSFEPILKRLNEARESFLDMSDILEELAETGTTDLKLLREIVYEFSRAVCSTSGRFFQALKQYNKPKTLSIIEGLSSVKDFS